MGRALRLPRALLALLLLASCASVRTTDARLPDASGQGLGVYSLPRIYMAAELGITEAGLGLSVFPPQVAADARYRLRLSAAPNAFSNDALTLSVDPQTGLLLGLNAIIEDRTDTILETVAASAAALSDEEEVVVVAGRRPAPDAYEPHIVSSVLFDPLNSASVREANKTLCQALLSYLDTADGQNPGLEADIAAVRAERDRLRAERVAAEDNKSLAETLDAAIESASERIENLRGAMFLPSRLTQLQKTRVSCGENTTHAFVSVLDPYEGAPLPTLEDVLKWCASAVCAPTTSTLRITGSIPLGANATVAVPVPDIRSLAVVDVRRSALVRRETAISAIDGRLLDTSVAKPSEVESFVSIPFRVVRAAASSVSEILQLRINIRAQQNALSGTPSIAAVPDGLAAPTGQTSRAARMAAERKAAEEKAQTPLLTVVQH